MKNSEKPAAAKPAKPVIPEVDAEVEKTIRSAFDLGHAAKLLREKHPELDQAARLEAIKNVCAKIGAERDRPNARREAIGRMARQHVGEPHKENR